MKFLFSSTALAATTLVIKINLKSAAAKEDKKPVRNRLNGLKGTTINRDLMSMPAIEDGIMPGIPGQPDPALVPASLPSPDLANFLMDAIPEASLAGFLNKKIIPPPTPSPTPTPTPSPTVPSLNLNEGWETYGDMPWFIATEGWCGPYAPSDLCFHAGKLGIPTYNLVGNPDAEVGDKKKKKKRPENLDGIEAITHGEKTALENTFDFPADGILDFFMFCESERGFDFCDVYIDGKRVIHDSGYQGWKFQRIPVSKGPTTVKWEYSKDVFGFDEFQDTMKLAEIMFTPSIVASLPAITITDTTV